MQSVQVIEGCKEARSRGLAFMAQPCAHRLVLNRRSTAALRGSADDSSRDVQTARIQRERTGSCQTGLLSYLNGVSCSDRSTIGRRAQVQGLAGGLLLRGTAPARSQACCLERGTFGRLAAATAQGWGSRIARNAHEIAADALAGMEAGGLGKGTLQISTFNIWCPLFRRMGSGGAEGAGGGGDARECDYRELYVPRNLEIIEQILEEDSDIVCIQEFWVNNADMVGLYTEKLGHKYHLHQLCRTGGRGDGLVTLLKHGIQVKDKRDIMFRDLGDRYTF